MYKSGETSRPTNYILISMINNLLTFFKTFEKIDFFINNNVFINNSVKNQYGFLKSQVLKSLFVFFLQQTGKDMNCSLKSIAAFLDLDKAFYTVSHQILIDKLYKYDIQSKALDLKDNCLQRRKKVGQNFSAATKVQTCVPQETLYS